MSHTVKLEDRIFNQLESFRDKRETFSQAVERLLAVKREILEAMNVLDGQIKFREWQREELEKLPAAREG